MLNHSLVIASRPVQVEKTFQELLCQHFYVAIVVMRFSVVGLYIVRPNKLTGEQGCFRKLLQISLKQ